ncbi:MAG: hypothetical protein V8S77_02260 [Oscillospiraceae bacterium]
MPAARATPSWRATAATSIIEGGFFYTNYNWRGFYYVLNQKNNNPGITVKGGTFVNYDPSRRTISGRQLVADGYSVVSEKHGDDIWYTVVKGTGVIPGTQEDLNNAITDSTTKDVAVIMPADQTLTLDNGIANEGAKARNITFVGDGTQTVDVITNATGAEGGQLNYQRGSTFTFENVTVQGWRGQLRWHRLRRAGLSQLHHQGQADSVRQGYLHQLHLR